jgi:hypothetical protein
MAKSISVVVSGNAAPLRKALGEAGDSISSFGGSVKKFALPAAAALGAVAFAGLDAAKAAIEDEAAAKLLERQLKATTGATEAQVKATEDFVTKMSLASGTSDSELRPALGKLVRATGDLTKSQELLGLAQDISIQTGKPLSAVSDALGKSFNGQHTALMKLDPSLRDAIKSGASAEEVFSALNGTFGGASAEYAKTYEGQLKRVNVALDESKETIGAALLPALGGLLDFVNGTVVPGLSKMGDVLQEDGLVKGFQRIFTAGVEWIGSTGLPMLRDKLLQLGGALVEWIGPRIGPMVKALGDFVAAGANWLLDTGLPTLVEKLQQWGDAFVAWIGPAIVPMLQGLGELIAKIGVWLIGTAVPKLVEFAARLAWSLTMWAFELGPEIIKGLGLMVLEIIKKIPEMALKLGKGFADLGIGLGKSLVNGIIDMVNGLIGKLNNLLEFTIPVPFGPDIKVNAPDLAGIPKLAQGGLVMGPQLSVIGEAGPELVVPLDKIGKLGGGNTYQITVQTGVGDPREIGRQVVDAIKQYERTAGPVFAAA